MSYFYERTLYERTSVDETKTYTVIGAYGAYGVHSMYLGGSDNIEGLMKGLAHRMSSINPTEKILFFVYKKGKFVGRIIDEERSVSCTELCTDLFYLNNEDFKKWQEKREKERETWNEQWILRMKKIKDKRRDEIQ